jgi:hypothetical protein
MEKIFRGLYPRTPKGEGEGRGEGREKKMGRIGEGRGGEREGRKGKGEGRRGGATAPPKMFVCPRPWSKTMRT